MAGFDYRAFIKEDIEESNFSIYPNPASHLVNIEFDYSKSAVKPTLLQVIDESGRVIYQESITTESNFLAINTTHWSSGQYFYTLYSKEEILKSGKIEIIH